MLEMPVVDYGNYLYKNRRNGEAMYNITIDKTCSPLPKQFPVTDEKDEF